MSLQRIADAANDLAELLEASAPRGLRHPKHAQHIAPARAKIKAVMAHFFARQRKAVLAAVKPHIKRQLEAHPVPVVESESQPAGGYEGGRNALNSHLLSARESISPQGKTFASALLPRSLQPLSFAATRAEESEYNSAITDLISAAAKSLDASAAVGEDFAGQYLRSNSLSKLTGGLNNTSIDRLQNAIGDAWDKGGSYDQIVQAITDTFDDFSDARAELIAQTEANDAYNAGRASVAASLDMDEKRWDPDGEACAEICQPNADQGWIPIDEDFQSGDDAPTGHPNCDCSTDFRKSSDDEEEES